MKIRLIFDTSTKFLQVLYDVTVKISGSLYSTSNRYFSTLQKVYNCLTKYCDSDDILLSTMAIKMKSKYDKYWGDFEQIIPLFVTFVLDPRYKIEVLEFWFMSNVGEGKTNKIFSNLKNVLNQLYNHYAMNVGESGAYCQMKVGVAQVQPHLVWVVVLVLLIK